MHDFPVPALPMTRYLNKKSVKPEFEKKIVTESYSIKNIMYNSNIAKHMRNSIHLVSYIANKMIQYIPHLQNLQELLMT